jgi:hypothetical protein
MAAYPSVVKTTHNTDLSDYWVEKKVTEYVTSELENQMLKASYHQQTHLVAQ